MNTIKKGPDEMRTRLYRSVNAADLPNIVLVFLLLKGSIKNTRLH